MNRKVYLSDFGITGNGETMCTTAFQRAIDILENGDELYISSGEYTVGTLFLHSNTRIFLEKGAVSYRYTNLIVAVLFLALTLMFNLKLLYNRKQEENEE